MLAVGVAFRRGRELEADLLLYINIHDIDVSYCAAGLKCAFLCGFCKGYIYIQSHTHILLYPWKYPELGVKAAQGNIS